MSNSKIKEALDLLARVVWRGNDPLGDARAELAELEKDRERVDFLSAHRLVPWWWSGQTPKQSFFTISIPGDGTPCKDKYNTPREAIDAAIIASQ